MEWRRNPFFYTTLALAVVAAGLGVVAVRAAAPDVVATVNGQPITVDELYSELAAGPGRTVVDQLIARKLVEQEAAVRGVKVTDAEVDAELAGVRGNFASQEAFQQALAMSGIDEAGLREQIRFQMYLRKLLEPQVDLSDKALRAYFDQRKEDLGQREAVRLRGILVATEQEARAVRQEIVGGKDFAQVAKERSLDPLTRDAGGDMGMVERGQLAPELESVAFSLPPGQVSDPVKTAEGWRVLRVEEHRPATAAVFENVKDRIRVILLDQAVQERGPAWLEQLRQKAKITNRLDNG